MEELKPCPFCGGEAELRPNDRGIRTPDIYGWHVECTNDECIIGLMDDRQWFEETKAEAIAAWNTRAERTCRVVCIIDGLTMDEPNSIELSCGHTFETWDEIPPNYCPNCGARVIKSD